MLETTIIVTIISTLGMLSPGPDFFMLLKNASRYQRNAAMMTAAGITCGIATHMVYCVAGIAVVIATTPWLFNILKYAGAAYLIWVGIQALLATTGTAINFSQQTKHSISLQRAFMQGYLCNLLNPKATLFFLSVFTQVLDIHSSFSEKLWYASIIVLLGIIWWPLLVILIQSQPVQRGLTKMQKIIDKLLGGVLIALGIKVAFFS